MRDKLVKKTKIAYIILLITIGLLSTIQVQNSLQSYTCLLSQTIDSKNYVKELTPKAIEITKGDEIQVNTFISGEQWTADVSCNSSGAFTVVWRGNGSGDTNGIYLKNFDSKGMNLTNDILVNDQYTGGSQITPSISYNSEETNVITWSSLGEDEMSYYGVITRIFNSTGQAQTDHIIVNTNTTDDQYPSSIDCFNNGSFVIAWEHDTTSSDDDIYVKIFNATGDNRTDDIMVNTNKTSNQKFPSVGCFNNGSFIVTWCSDQDGDYDIYAKVFNSTGHNQTDDILVNEPNSNFDFYHRVCCFGNDTFIVTWQGDVPGDIDGIGVRIFNYNGTPLTGEIRVNTNITSSKQNPDIDCFDNGSFVVAWESNGQDGSGWGIFAKLFNLTGVNQTDDILVNKITTNDQQRPSVCCYGNTSFIISWDSMDQDGSARGVFCRIFNGPTTEHKKGAINPLILLLIPEDNTMLALFIILPLIGVAAAIAVLFYYRKVKSS